MHLAGERKDFAHRFGRPPFFLKHGRIFAIDGLGFVGSAIFSLSFACEGS